jgi:hypothetical protein
MLELNLELDTADGNAKRFKLSPFTVRRLGSSGKIREFRCGRAVRYSPAELLEWMEAQGRASASAHQTSATPQEERCQR